VSLRSILPGPVPRSRSVWINQIPMNGTRSLPNPQRCSSARA
jgi:hypothetical protein